MNRLRIQDFRVAGTQHHAAYEAHAAALVDGTKLTLQADPANEHDPNAVRVLHDGQMIGYVEAAVAPRIRGYMENAGVVAVYATVLYHDPAARPYDRVVATAFAATPAASLDDLP